MSINKSRKKRTREYEYEYDYENFYTESIDAAEDDVIEKLLKSSSIRYHYMTKTIRSGSQFEVEIYPRFSGNDFEKYQPSRKPTRLKQKSLNDRNARKYFIRLINANFTDNDYVIHLTYVNDKLPKNTDDAEKEVKKYIKRINYHRKKAGLGNCRYIYVTEFDNDKKIRCHHHMIVDGGLDRLLLKKLWKNGKRTRVDELEPDEFDLTGLAMYLSKDPKGKKRWKSSKGLKKPIERKSYTSFSNRKIRNMVDDQTKVSAYMNSKYASRQYLSHEVRYNSINRMFYIYVRMRVKERMNI